MAVGRDGKAVSLGDQILEQLEAERQEREGYRSDLALVANELNSLRALGAALNERLELAEILAALKLHMPGLFDLGVLFVLIAGEEPAVHVYPRVQLHRDVVDKLVEVFLHRYALVSGAQLRSDEARVEVAAGLPQASSEAPTRFDSHVTLPLVSGGDTVGCISMVAPEANAFDHRDVQLFSLVSYQLSTSIRNALLLLQTREQAIRDGLTGLFNRRHFDERFAEEYRRAERYGHPFALILGDIDHFKSINDGAGHMVGDRVLQDVSRMLRVGLRHTDMLFRYGGEEFAAILPATSVDEGLVVAERLRMLIEEIDAPDAGIPVRMSFGVAGTHSTEGEMIKFDELIGKADEALYMAKASGRNQVCVALGLRPPKRRSVSSKDRRRFPRLKANLGFKYVMVPEISTEASEAQTIEVSRQGMRFSFAADRPPPAGAFILVELEGEDSSEPLKVLSRVAWSKTEGEGRVLMGTRILNVDEASASRFHTLIDRLEAENEPFEDDED